MKRAAAVKRIAGLTKTLKATRDFISDLYVERLASAVLSRQDERMGIRRMDRDAKADIQRYQRALRCLDRVLG